MVNTLAAPVTDSVRWSLLAAVVVIVAVACGGDGTGQMDINSLLEDSSGEHGHDHASESVGGLSDDGSEMSLTNTTGDVPDLDMTDVSTGAIVNLRSLVDNNMPLMFWFWEPH